MPTDIPAKMRAVELRSFGLTDLHEVERSVPSPGPSQIVIRIKAVSLNYRDIVVAKGVYKPDLSLPYVPLSDAVGEVVDLGEGVTRFRVGDLVLPTFIQGWISGVPDPQRRANATLGWPLTGVLQDYIVVPADDAVLTPANMTDVEASTLPIAGLTAWSALTEGNIKAGDWVLVQGTGGVALFALQFAKMMGARVAVVTSSEEKIARVHALGADAAINYRQNPQWAEAVRAATGGRGIDIVVETVGSTLPEAIKALAFGGFIGVVGFLGGFETSLNLVALLERMIRIKGIAVGSRDQFEAMNRAIVASGLKPVVDQVLPFDKTAEAFALMDRGGHFGKIVLTP